MSFTEISKGRFAKEKATHSVRLASYIEGQVKISISDDIIEKIGSPMFFKVAVGDGKHKGFLALIPTRMKTANSYTIHKTQSHFTITSGQIGVPPSMFKVVKVPHEITDDGIVIDIRGLRVQALQAAE